jgi:hypothetical protein
MRGTAPITPLLLICALKYLAVLLTRIIIFKIKFEISHFSVFFGNTLENSTVFFWLHNFKRIVSRDFVVCFLWYVSFDRSEVCTHAERVRLLLKFRFRVEFFDFHVSA